MVGEPGAGSPQGWGSCGHTVGLPWQGRGDREGIGVTVVGASTARTPAAPRLLQVLRTPSRVLPVTVPLLAVVLAGLVMHTGGRHIDLEVYRFGVQAWLAGGDLYGPLPETSGNIALPFIYPPFAAVVMVPLAVVPWLVAWAGLLGLSALS